MTEPRNGKPDGWVYFIEAVGADRIKIGWTSRSSAEPRRDELAANAPFEVRVLLAVRGTQRAEQWLHAQWSRHQARGEWFHASEGLQGLLAHFGYPRVPR